MLVMVLADVAFVSAEIVFYDKKSDFSVGIQRPPKYRKFTDRSTSPWRSMDPCFSDCCRSNDDHHFIQENQWLHDSIQKFNFLMPDQFEHQNSTGYCFEEEKHYGKYKKMSKIFHCCSLAVLSLMMVEVICKIIFLPKHYFTHKLEMFDGLIGRVIKNFLV